MDDHESRTPQHDPPDDARSRSGDLDRLAAANADATFGEDARVGRGVVPGVLSGDVGPKGRVGSQHRDLSRRQRSTMGEVPRGTVASGGGRYLLATMLLLALGALALLALVAWLVTR